MIWFSFRKGNRRFFSDVNNQVLSTDVKTCSVLLGLCLLIGCGKDLHKSATEGDLLAIKRLVQNGIAIDKRNATGYTALFLTSYHDHVDIVEFLLEAGADAQLSCSSHGTPLHAAAMQGANSVISLLLEYGSGLDIEDGAGLTPLWHAARYGHSESVVLLLGGGAKPNKIKERSSPLHAAAMYGHEKVALLLVSAGADVSARNQHGYVPLHYAIQADEPKIVQLFLEHGADITISDKNGRDMLPHAHYAKATKAEAVLRNYLSNTTKKKRD